MPYEDIAGQTDSLSQLSSMPGDEGGGLEGGPSMPEGPQAEGPVEQLGGPGADTPQEQQALQLASQAAVMFRQAAEADPSIRYIADKYLPLLFMDVMKHYGMEEEGKMQLQQAQMQSKRQRSSGIMGPPMAPTGPGGQ